MKIYLIGDSISIQYGPYLEQYLRGSFDYERKSGEATALLDLDQAQGANGGDSGHVLAFLRAAAKQQAIRAELLLFNCGLHDIKRDPASGRIQVSATDYGHNLQAIVAVIRSMNCRPVWIRTTPCDEKVHNTPGKTFHRFRADVEERNAIADRLMGQLGVPAIDLHGFTLNLGTDLYRDHVHFHEHIREKQAAFIAGWLDARHSGNTG